MSGDTFHVHGPHDHELEHAQKHAGEGHGDAAHHGLAGGSMTNQIALFTALIATVGATFSYMAGATQADAGLFKNDAAIKKTEASNQWNFYQAKSNKQNLSELGMQLVDDARKPVFEKEAQRYAAEKAEIKLAAEKLEKESTEFNEKSEAQMHQHHRWAQATTALQIAIAMAAIALLTKRRWLEKTVFAMSGVGLVLGALAYFHV